MKWHVLLRKNNHNEHIQSEKHICKSECWKITNGAWLYDISMIIGILSQFHLIFLACFHKIQHRYNDSVYKTNKMHSGTAILSVKEV